MIISSAAPSQIIEWFQTADHGQEVLCVVLATSRPDRKKLAALIRDFFQVDAALGSKVAFLVLHPDAQTRIGIDGRYGRLALLQGDVFPRRSNNDAEGVALRNSPLFRDMSDAAETIRSQLSVESARTMARVVPDFMELFEVEPAELPVVCTLVRGRTDVIIVPLGVSWTSEDLVAYFAQLRAIADRPRDPEPRFPELSRAAVIEDGLREITAKQTLINTVLEGIARRYKATAEDRRKLAEYIASSQYSATILAKLLKKLSFSEAERFLKDGQVAKVQALAERVTSLNDHVDAHRFGASCMEEELSTLRTRDIQKCDISPSINELAVRTLPGLPGKCPWFAPALVYSSHRGTMYL